LHPTLRIRQGCKEGQKGKLGHLLAHLLAKHGVTKINLLLRQRKNGRGWLALLLSIVHCTRAQQASWLLTGSIYLHRESCDSNQRCYGSVTVFAWDHMSEFLL